MCAGRGVLAERAERPALGDVAAKWDDRVDVTLDRCYERPANLEAMRVRPDDYAGGALRLSAAGR